ncbi:MAG TPA: hypothetical protein VFF80_03750 [Bacillota bacterium]|nr:hypothetical protein [Bacillota bacterium]
MKSVSYLVLIGLILTMLFSSVYAKELELQRFTYIINYSTALSIDANGTAYCLANFVTADPYTLKTALMLQKYQAGSWLSVNSWSDSTTSDVLQMSESCSVTAGTYRTSFTGQVFDGQTLLEYASSVSASVIR